MGKKQRINVPYDMAGPRLSVAAAAAHMGCSESWIYKLVAAGELKALRIGTRKGMQITVRSMERYLARKTRRKTEVS